MGAKNKDGFRGENETINNVGDRKGGGGAREWETVRRPWNVIGKAVEESERTV